MAGTAIGIVTTDSPNHGQFNPDDSLQYAISCADCGSAKKLLAFNVATRTQVRSVSLGAPVHTLAFFSAPAPPALALDKAAVDFGAVRYGSSRSELVTLASSGSSSLSIGTLALAGANPGDFTVGSDACSGTVLSPGGTCTFAVAFAPIDVGTRSASVEIASNAADSPRRLPLQGTGLPNLSVNPSAIDFGQVAVGSSFDLPASVRNEGAVKVTVDCTTAAPFALPEGCGFSLDPGAVANIVVRFSPTEAGTARANLTFAAGGPAVSATLLGEGLSTAPAMLIESLYPSSGASGAVVAIRSRGGFGRSQPAGSEVRFGPDAATVLSWSDKEIRVLTPAPLAETAAVFIQTTSGRSNSALFTYAAFRWPVDIPIAIQQGFAEFADYAANKYHTGRDIGTRRSDTLLTTNVHPAAAGEVVLIQQISATDDHGFGNTVVVKHWLAGENNFVYSQYSHLSSIADSLRTALASACGEANKKTGRMSCSDRQAAVAVGRKRCST